jgi:hypothetical protein
VTITVTATNTPPLAAADSYRTAKNTLLTIPAPGVLANDIDPDGNSLRLGSVLTQPTNGTLSINADGSFTYRPNGNYVGLDSFTYKASDGAALSTAATVVIQVSDANTPPLARSDTFTTPHNTRLNVAAPGLLANDNDPDGNQPLLVVVASRPTKGALALSAGGGFTYTPNGGACASDSTDSFTYYANDSVVNSNLATVTITLHCVNRAPVAINDSYSAPQGVRLSIPAPGLLGNDSDADGNTVTAILVTPPARGTLSLDPRGGFSYTSATPGTDSFTYKVTDGALESAPATVTISVAPPNNFTLGGTLTGLAGGGPLVLSTSTGQTISLTANGAFSFASPLADGTSYLVSVTTQPTNPPQICSVTGARGSIAGANVNSVRVTCAAVAHTIGGTLAGLASGSRIILAKNSGDSLLLTANGAFTFPTALADNSTYLVTVQTQPATPAQVCTVTNGNGTVAGANVTNVRVVCAAATYTVGGTLAGLASGSRVVLAKNSGDILSLSADGVFTFPTALADMSEYVVTVQTQPSTPAQTCSVTNGRGNLAGANVTNVAVNCIPMTTTTVTGTVAGGTGQITATVLSDIAGCGFTRANFVSVASVALPPPGVTFPFGMLDFATAGCGSGGSVTVRLTYAQPLPANVQYWKFGRANRNATAPSWYLLPATISGNQIQFTVKDGELGDDDWTANGVVVDPSGPGIPEVTLRTPTAVPTMSQWALILLAFLLTMFGVKPWRRVSNRSGTSPV